MGAYHSLRETIESKRVSSLNVMTARTTQIANIPTATSAARSQRFFLSDICTAFTPELSEIIG
jgi:hypothetical protein